ncbi:MAG TPA: antitoxin AF2212-like protein [Candidatus Limnocylindrales bacterium]|nr:antitoxin AF2212-like protein [Candidatus Limnocylindrales bacterium]
MIKTKTVHAIFNDGVLRPIEPIDLDQNARYLITIRKEPTEKKNPWNILEEFSGKIEGPKDWSREHDHYLYGVPKRGKKNPVL